MRSTHQLLVTTLLGLAGALLALSAAAPRQARAQNATTGAIQGYVSDGETGERLTGVTVVVKGPSGAAQGTYTDEHGFYKVTSLVPSRAYSVSFYWADIAVTRERIAVGVNETTALHAVLTGEIIYITDVPPPVDPSKTTLGHTFHREDLKHLAVPGTGFEDALGQTPGSASGGAGIGFSGSDGLENQFYIDGVNTTGLKYGTSGTSMLNEFIEEIEVITGGYNAEYGRATGGLINVVTRTGSNQHTGSVFAYVTPGQLVASRDRTPTQATSIDTQSDLAYSLDVGFEVGGPIIEDRLWYWVGFAPQLSRTTTTRTTKRRTDCRVTMADGTLSTGADQRCTAEQIEAHADGDEDIDPATGFYIYEDLDSRALHSDSRAYALLAKLNVAATARQQGQLSVQVQPGSFDGQRPYGFVEQQQLETSSLTTDVAARWTSKLHDDKTEIEAVIGVHRSSYRFGSRGGERDDVALQVLTFGSLGTWAGLGNGSAESMATRQGCQDNTGGDPYQFIANCPDVGVGYAIGGPGSLADDTEQRLSAKLSVVRRLEAWGNHEVKAGADVEDNTIANRRAFSGDVFLQNLLDRGEVRVQRWVKLGADAEASEAFPDMCRDRDRATEYACDYLDADDAGSRIEGQTLNWSAYLRDSWQVRPNVTLNAGLRYEEQRLRYVEGLQHTTDPLTGRRLGSNAMVLQNMWAPRLGAIWDPTREGRSKVYGHWGRFYESIPLDINDRSFGGEVLYHQYFDSGSQCGGADVDIGGADGNGCLVDPAQRPAVDEFLLGSGVLVAPGIKAQYLDEVILGAEYVILDDTKLGVTYQNRQLGRVIEDVSVDGAQTYIIANPGEWSREDERRLEDQIATTADEAERDRLSGQLEQFRGIRGFDKPRRDYHALQLTLSRRFSGQLYLQGSYTFSRTEGNFPGLFSADNGQADPNISSQYDLIELLANRDGPLPQDRPHYVKLDGYYTFDLKRAGRATAGLRLRALSGTPVDVLGKHYRYGTDESFILPRGVLRRTDFETSIDLHADYARPLGHGIALEVFADVFNVSNDQGTFAVDETYTYLSNVNPISGGSYADLIFAKQLDDDGGETSTPIQRNPNFGRVAARYSPLSARFGVRLTF